MERGDAWAGRWSMEPTTIVPGNSLLIFSLICRGRLQMKTVVCINCADHI